MMTKAIKHTFMLSLLCLMSLGVANAQSGTACNATVTSGNETPCGVGEFPCCSVYNACNGTATACNNYDPDFSATGGCDLSCAPIDSGVLFLLLGGAAFGGMMIMRRREHATQIIR